MYKKEIRAVYTEHTIRVYQAYNDIIAEEAIQLGTFGSHFKKDRMTWIKSSFLWMMYRCGWAEKENQTRVLAIDIKREAFDYLVNHAVLSKYQEEQYADYEEWKKAIQHSNIRCQWDPERDIYGNPLQYRSIQLGIKGEAVHKYITEWIVKITDITDFVKELKYRKDNKQDISTLLPVENVYDINENI